MLDLAAPVTMAATTNLNALLAACLSIDNQVHGLCHDEVVHPKLVLWQMSSIPPLPPGHGVSTAATQPPRSRHTCTCITSDHITCALSQPLTLPGTYWRLVNAAEPSSVPHIVAVLCLHVGELHTHLHIPLHHLSLLCPAVLVLVCCTYLLHNRFANKQRMQ